MRNRKTAAINQGELLNVDQLEDLAEQVRPKRKKTEVAIRPKTMDEIITDNAAALGNSVDGVKLIAKLDLHKAMLRVDWPIITKDNKITLSGGRSYSVASITSIQKAVNHLLQGAGLRMFFLEVDQPDKTIVKVNCILTNGVHEEVSPVTFPIAPGPGQSPQQGKASGMTYACRHGMMRLLNLISEAPEDRDVEPVKEEQAINREQLEYLYGLIADNTNTDNPNELESLICKHYHVSTIDDLGKLPSSKYDPCKEAIIRYGKRNKK